MNKGSTQIIITILLFIVIQANGQNYSAHSQFIAANRHGISPAFSSHNGNTVLITEYYKQWLAVPGSPEQLKLQYFSPIREDLHLGLNISQQSNGNFTNLKPSFYLANQIRVSEQSKLFFGIGANYKSMHFSTSNLRGDIDNDPVLIQAGSLKSKRLFFGAGAAWKYKNFSIGTFSDNLIGMYFKNPYRYSDKIDIGLHAHYDYNIDKAHQICAALLLHSVPADLKNEFRYQTEILWNYENKIYGGLSVSTALTVGVLAGAALSEKVLMFYSYSSGFGAPAIYSSGNHAIQFNILLKRKPIPESNQLFPVSESEKETIRSEKMQEEYKNELEQLKQHFNKTIYEYDRRIKELEEKIKSKEY